ncbi:MAG: RDD family protein [Pseudomonadota bacterium]|nr:RDD family protein [Pseudomonadota bacterium]
MSAVPAGFWRRYAAWTLDAALHALPVLLLAWTPMVVAALALGTTFDALAMRVAAVMLEAMKSMPSALLPTRQMLDDPALQHAATALQSALGDLLLTPLLGFVALSLLWHVGFERSARQATPGQRVLGLMVVDARGQRLPAGHALLRFGAGALSWLTLNLGHALAALPPRHLTLHDRVSGTRVVCRGPQATPLPPWARLWIAMHGLALLAFNGWLLQRALQAMQRAFDSGW